MLVEITQPEIESRLVFEIYVSLDDEDDEVIIITDVTVRLDDEVDDVDSVLDETASVVFDLIEPLVITDVVIPDDEVEPELPEYDVADESEGVAV